MRNLIFLIMLVLTPVTYSQVTLLNSENTVQKRVKKDKPNKFISGFNLSPVISWLDVDHTDLQNDGATITGGLGFTTEYLAGKFVSLVSGVNLILPGGYVYDLASLSNQNTRSNFRINIPSVEIPLLFRINTLPFENTTYYIQGGINAAYRFAATEFHRSASYQTADVRNDITPLISPFRLNTQFGFGAKFRVLRKFFLFAEINYKNSIENIASETGYNTLPLRYSASDPVPDIRNGNMVFSVGVLF